MRRYFAQTTPLIALVAAIFQGAGFQGAVFADGLGSTSPSGISQPVSIEGLADSPVVEEEAPLFRHSTYPAAWTAAQKSNRPILVYVSMPNCPHCVRMVKNTYKLPEVGKMVSSSFETIYAGRFTHAKLVRKLKVKWYPTTILVGPNNKILDVIEGYVEPKTFKRRLQTGLATASPQTQTR